MEDNESSQKNRLPLIPEGLAVADYNTEDKHKELIISKSKRKKRICLTATVIVALIVLAIIIAAIVLLKAKGTSQAFPFVQNGNSIALEDILHGTLTPKMNNATWISGDELMYKDLKGNLKLFNVRKRSTEILLPSSNPVLQSGIDLKVSPDRKYLLIQHNYHKIYRYSAVASYTIINLETTEPTQININGDEILQYAEWGPRGNSLVYVAQNNIFYQENVDSDIKQITKDGVLYTIYNGIPDWVYEEEVFSSNSALWFSPDGKKLAYAKFNDTLVPFMALPVYGTPGRLEDQYTRSIQIRYPKPGHNNPSVSLHVVDLETLKSMVVKPPENGLYRSPILAAVSWATGDILSAIWMNRVQNHASIVTYNTIASNQPEIVKAIHEKNGWVELFKAPLFSKDGSKMLMVLSQNQQNNTGGFRHLTLLNTEKDSPVTALTKGRFVVSDILSWDDKNNLIYYEATDEDNPSVQHVYSISLSTKQSKCLSCGEKTSIEGTKCLYNSAEFSKDQSHFVLNCNGPGVPEVSIHSVEEVKNYLWEDNKDLVDMLSKKSIPKIQKYTFPVEGGFQAQVLLKLPPNLVTNGDVKYPMVVNVYAGPDSNQVVERFSMDWGSYLAANKSIIYASIDGRGSGLKGDKMLFAGYRNLGTVEVYDQINVTRQIQKTLPFVDPMRTAIWGWSYGGYASAKALEEDKDGVFKCGMSVAPVTDWALYDSIYTERFMGLPTVDDNMQGYKNAQLYNKDEALNNKQYYLIHGTLDDNVHYQQSMLFSKDLEFKDVLFRQQSYPDEDHGLLYVRPHLYHSLEEFLDECFIGRL